MSKAKGCDDAPRNATPVKAGIAAATTCTDVAYVCVDPNIKLEPLDYNFASYEAETINASTCRQEASWDVCSIVEALD